MTWVLDLNLTTCFASIFRNGANLPDVNHFIKCGLRAAKWYVELNGSMPNGGPASNAIEKSLAWHGLLTHFLDKMNMQRFGESHIAVFFGKNKLSKI